MSKTAQEDISDAASKEKPQRSPAKSSASKERPQRSPAKNGASKERAQPSPAKSGVTTDILSSGNNSPIKQTEGRPRRAASAPKVLKSGGPKSPPVLKGAPKKRKSPSLPKKLPPKRLTSAVSKNKNKAKDKSDTEEDEYEDEDDEDESEDDAPPITQNEAKIPLKEVTTKDHTKKRKSTRKDVILETQLNSDDDSSSGSDSEDEKRYGTF